MPLKVDERDEAASEPVNALLYAGNGASLWIGTDGRGVIHRTAQGSVNVSELAGLSQESGSRTFSENAGVVWVATHNGVERITPASSGDRVECPDRARDRAWRRHDSRLHVRWRGWNVDRHAAQAVCSTGHRARRGLIPLGDDSIGPATAVYRDARGRIWAGAQHGLVLLTRKGAGFAARTFSRAPMVRWRPSWVTGRAMSGSAREDTEFAARLFDGRDPDTGPPPKDSPTTRFDRWLEDNEGNLWFGMLSGGLEAAGARLS